MLRIAMTKTLPIGMMTLLSAGATLAQTSAGTQKPESVSTPATPYLLAGDDVLSINVVNFPALSQPQVTVWRDGKLAVPLLEPFSILGKTTTEVAQMLTEKWKKYMVNPSVRVSLLEKRKDNVLVYGFVLRPGTAEYKPPMRLLEVVAQFGGPLPTADMSCVVVTRKAGTKETLDLNHPETRDATANDVLLNPGDVVYIPERHTGVSVLIPEIRNRIYVFGAVGHPGFYAFKPGERLMDALNGMGRPTLDANLKKVILLHIAEDKQSAKDTEINLEKLLKKGDLMCNVPLTEGDVIYVPKKNHTMAADNLWGILIRFGLVVDVAHSFTCHFGD